MMEEWDQLVETVPHVEPMVRAGLEKATKYYKRMDDTIAYGVAMC